jgi:predicted pyridoxine 5'-phosphate oxidase superfamily flavin-nucleotide-binding protein
MKQFAQKVMELIRKREFISVATADPHGQPNAAPKFVLKLDEDYIYLIDYTIGRTYRNLKINPRASVSFMDPKTLIGYQVSGSVKIIEKGPVYKKMCGEMLEKKIALTAKHIIEEVRGAEAHESFELIMPEKYVIFKVRLEEIATIGPRGELTREKVR